MILISKPVLFSTPMVKAILEGRKTMTRRVVKPQPAHGAELTGLHYGVPWFSDGTNGNGLYNADDILYVRETWASALLNGGPEGFIDAFAYKADGSVMYPVRGVLEKSVHTVEDLRPNNAISGWRPSIFMPKDVARLFLRVTDVRVERLQQISGEDITREGVGNGEFFDTLTDRAKFRKLWDNLYKPNDLNKYGWDANPWVWVVSFERCDKP